MLTDLFEQIEKDVVHEPQEIGVEGISQIKGDDQQQKTKATDTSLATDRKEYLRRLYGISDKTPDQVDQLYQQDVRKRRVEYEQIQRSLQELRAKKAQEVRADEVGQMQGTKVARTQEEKQDLWEEQKKKAEEQRKKDESITAPGSAANRSGEGAKVMG